jgi:hypothetical protein
MERSSERLSNFIFLSRPSAAPYLPIHPPPSRPFHPPVAPHNLRYVMDKQSKVGLDWGMQFFTTIFANTIAANSILSLADFSSFDRNNDLW